MEKKEYQLNFNVDISALTEVKNILQDISVQLQELGKQTEKNIFGKMFDFADKASSIGSFLISLSGVIKGVDKEVEKIAGALKKALGDVKKDVKADAKEIGTYIGEGIIEGIKKSRTKVEVFAKELADDNVIRTVMKTLEISENVYTFAKGFT